MKRRAILSVTDKTGVIELARGLDAAGLELLSTGGTERALREAGVPVEAVADYTGFPEILGGRVKTLHPKVHGGILASPDDPTATVTLEAHGIDPIDVVVVNLYRFREAAAAGGSDPAVVEQIDIGGPCMLRAAAKNWSRVWVVVDPADYGRVVAALQASPAEQSTLRRELAAKAFRHTADYDTAVADWFAGPADQAIAAEHRVAGAKVQDLRYGENPHQVAALFADPCVVGPTLARASQLGGKELSYNNLVDLDSALGVVLEFGEPACAIVKHNNPCGAAVAPTLPAAFAAALASDPQSAFGGIAAFNRDLDEATARAIAESDVFVEAIVAPAVAPAAVDLLREGRGGKSLRLLSLGGAPDAARPLHVQPISGGFLVQSPDAPRPEPVPMETVTERAPTDAERASLAFAWRVAKHVKSNAIVLARPVDTAVATVGVGAGQMSRVDSVQLAITKAEQRAAGAVLASDAFFPFADGLEAAAAAGVTAAIQPGGSRRDAEVIEAANRAGMTMVLTGMRHFRH
ncbi:MAG: bifunctional phosphoribosylaminoimidazolecarboxamide formyltransferase/IMP cyclohydrolase [Planctomycetota bacterium]